MHSVCILIYVSMYSYGYLLCTHGISGLAARSDCQQFEVCLTMTTNMYSPSLSPPPLPVYLRTPAVALQRFTLGPWSSEVGDIVWGRDRASLEMQLETEIEWTQRCTGRPWSSKFRHALGRRAWVNSEMHSELWQSEFRDALAAGYDRGRLEEYMEVVDLEAVDGRRARCWDSIHRLLNSTPWEWALMKAWEWRDDRQSLVYAVLGVCCTQLMPHSGYAALGVCCTRC